MLVLSFVFKMSKFVAKGCDCNSKCIQTSWTNVGDLLFKIAGSFQALFCSSVHRLFMKPFTIQTKIGIGGFRKRKQINEII